MYKAGWFIITSVPSSCQPFMPREVEYLQSIRQKHLYLLFLVSQDVLQKATKSMETNLSKLERELESAGDSNDPEDKFKEVMSEFHNQAKEQCELLVEMFNNMTNMFKELAEYYCFDLKKTQLEDFFGDLSSFLQQYENAKKDNIKRKDREEKERKAKERAVSLCSNLERSVVLIIERLRYPGFGVRVRVVSSCFTDVCNSIILFLFSCNRQ